MPRSVAAEAVLVVFVAGLPAAEGGAMQAAFDRALDVPGAAVVQNVEHVPSDVEALEHAPGARAVAELVADVDLMKVDVRVCAVRTDQIVDCRWRTLEFGPSDPRPERRRAIAIVAVSMLPDAARGGVIHDETQPLSTTTPPQQQPAATHAMGRLQTELTLGAALGTPSTLGAEVGARMRLLPWLRVRVAGGVRAGSLAAIHARTFEVPLSAGVEVRWPLGRRFSLGARTEAVLQSRSVSRHVSGSAAESRQRWQPALRVGPELHFAFTDRLGMLIFAGTEVSASATHIVADGTTTDLALARAVIEVGPTLTFW